MGSVDDEDAARLLGRLAGEVSVPPVPVGLVDAARRRRRRHVLTAAFVVLLAVLLVLAALGALSR